MKQCLGCRGLVPEPLSACPNCAVEPRSSLKVLVAAAGLVALVATGTSCVALYGAPCISRQFDGGNNGCPGSCDTYLDDGGVPAQDPSHYCYQGDGGIP
jgi:RNA polymerase subunit RPABC4/transcription elongation factor Spt4